MRLSLQSEQHPAEVSPVPMVGKSFVSGNLYVWSKQRTECIQGRIQSRYPGWLTAHFKLYEWYNRLHRWSPDQRWGGELPSFSSLPFSSQCTSTAVTVAWAPRDCCYFWVSCFPPFQGICMMPPNNRSSRKKEKDNEEYIGGGSLFIPGQLLGLCKVGGRLRLS